MRHYNIPIFIPHQGCPFQCVYCDQKIIASQRKVPTVEDMTETIESHLATIPADGAEVEIAFFGGSFTAIDRKVQEEYLQAAAPYLSSGRVVGLRLSTRPDCIDEEILEFLNRWGVKTIELGVQSLSDQVLKTSARGYQAADVFKACRLIKQQGFKLGIQLMVGLPGDNYERDIETTRRTIELNPDMVRIYPTVVIASTPLDEAYRRGKYIPLSLEEAIAASKDMYLMFARAGIRVIRMGLQPGEELSREGAVAAGPFHPSMGELVQQEVFKDQARLLLEDYLGRFGRPEGLILWVNPRDISRMVGQHRSNIRFLTNHFDFEAITVIPSDIMERNQVGISRLEQREPEMSLNRSRFLERLLPER